jgi:hypothetical protein
MKRFRSRRYDPWPDLHDAHMRHYRALLERQDELSTEVMSMASRRLRGTYENYTIYATMGRDRRKLGPEFVERADREMGEAIEFATAFGRTE